MTGIVLTNINTFDEAQEFMRWLGERRDGSIALDTETEGFDWWRQKIRLVQIGDANRGWSMRWDRWSGLVEDMLQRFDHRIVMHNFKFDTKFMLSHGMDPGVHRIDDSRTIAHLLDPDRRTGLKPLSEQILGFGSKGQDRLATMMKNHNWDWRTIPYDVPEYWVYAAMDTVLTARISDAMTSQSDWERFKPLYDMEMACQIALMNMEIRGARVDLDYAQQKSAAILEWATEVRQWAADEYTERLNDLRRTFALVTDGGAPKLVDKFNIGSAVQCGEVMIADGWVPEVYTDSGRPSLAKEVMEHVDHPLAKVKVELAHVEKMASAYFDNFLDMADGDLLHATINPLGTRTGRMAVTQPALQTLPRDALVRDGFIPRDGNRLILVDYDQMEVRIGAHFFRDVQMVQDITTSEDIHAEVAARIYGIPIGKGDWQRQVTKNAVYAILYGSGIAKFAETAGISTVAAKEFMQSYNEMYPGIREFKNKLEQQAREQALPDGRLCVYTPYGRRQPMDPELGYKALNYLIQGTGADVLKHKIAQLDAAGFGEYMVLPVHDEIMFDVDADIAEDVKHDVEKIMTNEEFRVPLTVEGTIVERWGDKYR